MMKSALPSLACGLVLLLVVPACRDTYGPSVPIRLALENVPTELMERDTARLTATVYVDHRQIHDAPVTWASSDTTIASIDTAGLLSARDTGTVTITARISTLSEFATVRVVEGAMFAAPAADSVQSIALGPYFACALSDRRAYCWGYNHYQWLGVADTSLEVRQPSPVIGGFTFKRLYARCGLTPDGKAVCWGNQAGATPTPSIMAGHLTFATLAVGLDHRCGVDVDGVVHCWGGNSQGQLGRAPSSPVLSPHAVSLPEPVVAVTAGWYQTCALSVSGVVYCWGQPGSGLGRGGGPTGNDPAPVHSAVKFMRLYGATTNCALTRFGEAYCWGRDAHGDTSIPTPLPTTLRFVSLSMRPYMDPIESAHTCGITRDGTAYCWGSNGAGQLGNGGVTSVFPPAMTPVSGGLRFRQIGTGREFSCGITVDTTVYCWGTRDSGRLGDGYSSIRPEPVPVAPHLSFKEVSGFEWAQCALTTAGRPYCWGRSMGRIVMSGSGDVMVPTPLPVEQAFDQIGLGRENVCVLDTSGIPWCVGAPTYSSALAPVVTRRTFVSLSVGEAHACALTEDGTAYCWGTNEVGQLGTGEFSSVVSNPRAVATGLRFLRLSAGKGYTCGIAADGATYCWGGDFAGRMGPAALDTTCGPTRPPYQAVRPCTNRPTMINERPEVVDIGTSQYMTCWLDVGGRVYCFGRSETAPEECWAGYSMRCQRTPTPVTTSHSFQALYGTPYPGIGWDNPGGLDLAGLPHAFLPAGDGYSAHRLQNTVSLTQFSGQCGITSAQKLYCWGSNRFGGVGDGVPASASVPIPTLPLQ
jgi:alpha-tubulin suppressor-like RCC1 family protein